MKKAIKIESAKVETKKKRSKTFDALFFWIFILFFPYIQISEKFMDSSRSPHVMPFIFLCAICGALFYLWLRKRNGVGTSALLTILVYIFVSGGVFFASNKYYTSHYWDNIAIEYGYKNFKDFTDQPAKFADQFNNNIDEETLLESQLIDALETDAQIKNNIEITNKIIELLKGNIEIQKTMKNYFIIKIKNAVPEELYNQILSETALNEKELMNRYTASVEVTSAKIAYCEAKIKYYEALLSNADNINELSDIAKSKLDYYNQLTQTYSEAVGDVDKESGNITPQNDSLLGGNETDSVETKTAESDVDECQNFLPKLKERLLAEHKSQYLINHLYSDISNIQIFFSPTLNHCIYSLREQFFIYKGAGDSEGTNLYAKIYDYETDQELFSAAIGTKSGENFVEYRKFTSALEGYTGKNQFE